MILHGFMVVHACIFISFFLAHNTPISTTPQLSFWQELDSKFLKQDKLMSHICVAYLGVCFTTSLKLPLLSLGVANKLLHSVKTQKKVRDSFP